MPLPEFLISNYKNWKLNNYTKSKEKHINAAINKQKPKAVFISCSDSRVNPETIFKAEIGDFFVHRNIANIVPPYNDKSYTTAAVLEYAIKSLNVPHIVILGHSCCGGIEYGYQLHTNNKINKNFHFVNKWIGQLEHLFKKTKISDDKNKNQEFEKQNIKNSINNLLTYPFIVELKKNKKIQIHGLWYEIKSGKVMYLNEESNNFEDLNYL